MVKEPPKEADCCGSGCLKCVWDTYYEQVEEEGFKEEVQERGIAKTAGPFEMPQNCVKVVGVEEEGECALGVLGLASVSVCEITQFGCLKSIMLESTLQDHISIFTPNPPEVVSRLMTRLNYTDRTIKVLPSTFSDGADAPTYPYWIPQNTPLSLVTILMYFSDLSSRASVRQPVLHILAAFASPDEATALKHLASSAGLSEYRQKYCSSGKHVSLLDVLEEYPSACPPVGRLLSALPQLKARFFSNAAVGSVGEVLVNTSRQGLSSGALKKLMKGDTVFLGGPTPNIPLTPFRSPTSADRCLLISAGVGVSPIMRVLRGMPPSSAWVYHGCRTAEDIPHQHTLQQAARFSPCLSSQGYIWKKLLQDKEDIVSFAPAAVYICGPALMMKNTVSALEEVLTEGRVKELKENEEGDNMKALRYGLRAGMVKSRRWETTTREAAREAVFKQAAEAEANMQKELEETGFVLVNDPEPEPEPEEPEVTEKQNHDFHYQDKKLLKRLKGTPGFDEAQVQAMLPYARKDPSLLDDMQDMEIASHFQTIAREPGKAAEILKKYPKLQEILMKIKRIKEEFERDEGAKRKVE